MQNELKNLEHRWGLAIQSAAFGVWDLDPVQHRVHYSPQWKAMLGYGDVDEADSTAVWRERVHPDDLRPMLAALNAHLDGRSDGYEMEFRLRAGDGGWRWVLSRGRVVRRDEQGAPLRVVGTLTDLTDRHELESLRKERDLAAAANAAKTEFLSRMSHELRTPLNAVLGFAQLLQQRLGSADLDEQRRHVGHIEQAGWQLLAMINDVLDLSRIESGQLALQIEPVLLTTAWRQAADMLGPLAAERRVTLHAGPLPAGAVLRADALRLKQVLTNLLSNAIRYNRDGGSVRLDAQRDGTSWSLTLQDTGVGIPAAQMAHLFEPFNRLGRSGATGEGVGEGVGLGLVLTRWLVEHMGGTLAVHSVFGSGTTVELRLPAA